MREKQIWIVPLLVAVLVAGVGWWANDEVRHAIRQDLRGDLEMSLSANVTALEIWMANQKRIALSLAEEPRFRTLALELLEKGNSGGTNRAPLADVTRQALSSQRLQERLRTLGYGVAQLVDTNWVVVLDSGRPRARLGLAVAEELQPKYSELFASGDPIIITPFKIRNVMQFGQSPGRGGRGPMRPAGDAARGKKGPPPPGPPSERNAPPGRRWADRLREITVMQVAAPIKADDGTTRGALALIINPDQEFTRILSVARSGDSGETFAFDPEGLMISQSRFDPELKRLGLITNSAGASSALTLALRDPGGDLTSGFKIADTNAPQPLIQMVANAVNGGADVELEPFRDYRGVPVVGAWRWLPQYGFGVGTKIDVREAFHPLRVVQRVFIILFLLLVLASVLMLLFSHRQMVWRRRVGEAELKAKQLGQYKLAEKIGEGGMGVVYKAHHALLRRDTALKLLLPDKADPAAIRRFEREVRLTCRLTHPNTIQIYDYGHTPDGVFYYAMEYLDGLNLADLVERYGPQPDGRVIHVLAQVCESLNEAHALGLIHRDIKPANIILCDRGGVPDSVKVLDFGLVKRFGQDGAADIEVAGPDGIIGTPNFIAPEAIKDPATGDPRSDIYAVGALSYYLLTGQPVFEGVTLSEVCQKHLSEKPVPPGARSGRPICPQLESAIMRCLAKDPAARPQSARELAQLVAASPRAGDWTPEQRVAWWAGYREQVSHEDAHRTARRIAPSEATVKIEFSERTP